MKLEPLVPFEPLQTDRLPVGDNWIAQIKWDGVRMLVYNDGVSCRLWNRSGNERSMQYSEFLDTGAYCKAKSVILDGEMVALDANGRVSFHQIMKRDQLRSEDNLKLALQRVPVAYIVFDVLYADGRWQVDRPLAERRQLLERIVVPGERVQLAGDEADPDALLAVMRRHGMEGIVCKDVDSTYAIGGKDGRWLKKKLYRDMYAVVGGVTFRDGIVNALLLGLYDAEARLHYIGHAGSGMSEVERRAVTARCEKLKAAQRPFVNRPVRYAGACWVQPDIVVKVQYLNWTPDGSMRHPTIQAFVERDPDECTFGQL